MTFSLFSQTSFSQLFKDETRINSIYIEAKPRNGTLGVGYFSANYDRRFGDRLIPLIRVGFGLDFNDEIFGIPIAIAWLTNPDGKHHFEGGIGVTNRIEIFHEQVHYDPFSMITVQYRYHSRGGFLLRAGLNYYGYSYAIWYPVQLNPTISLGYTF